MKKSQGEIFGIALLFVIIIVGVIIYGQIKASEPNNEQDLIYSSKYSLLAETTLDTLLKVSTGCIVERNRNSIQNLVSYCQENSFFDDADPIIYCDGEYFNSRGEYPSCSSIINILNQTLISLFNSQTNSALGHISYEMKITTPHAPNSKLASISINNFNQINSNGNIINSKNYWKYGLKKAPSGLRSIPTANRNVDFELYLYYK